MNLAVATSKYIDKPFEKYGCVELVVGLMRDIGRPLPDEVDGLTVHNYQRLVDTNLAAAEKKLFSCFCKIGQPSNCEYPSIGDLLVVRQRSGRMFPAVCVGPGLGIASFTRKGVKVFAIDKYNRPVLARSVD